MLPLETSIQLALKVGVREAQINDIVGALPELGRGFVRGAAAEIIERLQDDHVERVLRGEAEIVCTRCGVVHTSGQRLSRRGARPRKLRTSSGEICFHLRQVTCRDCRRTWSPYAERLGLRPRQRIAEEFERKLVEVVTDLSYAKTVRLGETWLGAKVSTRTLHRFVQERGSRMIFTPAADCKVVVADGTKVPAARPRFGTDVRIAFQVLGRTIQNGRSVIQKRIVGWSIGPVGWAQALPPGIASEAIVTDRESGIAKVMAAQHPGVRHQLCEWHIGHTMKHLMKLDQVPMRERKAKVGELNDIIWKGGADASTRFRQFWEGLKESPRAQAMLRDSESRTLYSTPTAERTSSAAEREMREINRRTDVGVQWSVPGVNNMMKLRHAMRLNPDDFERVWSPVRPVRFELVPQA
jgi:hypothetical protein